MFWRDQATAMRCVTSCDPVPRTTVGARLTKYRTLDLFNMIYPDIHVRGIDGFMNLQLLLPLTLCT